MFRINKKMGYFLKALPFSAILMTLSGCNGGGASTASGSGNQTQAPLANPQLSVSTDNVFLASNQNDPSVVSKSLKIINSGNIALTVQDLTKTFLPPLLLSEDGCSSVTLQPGETCDIKISLQNKDSVSNAEQEPQIASTNLKAATFIPVSYAVFKNSALEFSSAQVDLSTGFKGPVKTAVLTLTNKGSQAIPLGFASKIAAPLEITQDNCGGTTLNAGASCTVSVSLESDYIVPSNSQILSFPSADGQEQANTQIGFRVSDAQAPGTPNLAWGVQNITKTDPSCTSSCLYDFDLTWDMWWGQNGTRAWIVMNGAQVPGSAQTLTDNSPNPQQGTVHLTNIPGGVQNFSVVLANDVGETTSAIVPKSVGDSPYVPTPPPPGQGTTVGTPTLAWGVQNMTKVDPTCLSSCLYNFDLSWDMWWGENGTKAWIVMNGTQVPGSLQKLTANTPNAQHGTFHLTNVPSGFQNFAVVLANDTTQTSSTVVQKYVGDNEPTPPPPPQGISLDGLDKNGQQIQEIVLTTENPTVTLSLLEDGKAPPAGNAFQVYTTNPTAVQSVTVNGSQVTITGKPGLRTGLKILDTSNQQVRYVGLVTKTANGDFPALPDYLAVGSVSEDDQGALNFWADYTDDSATGKRMDARYIYLNGGVEFDGWNNRVKNFITYSQRYGMLPIFVLYGINNGSDSYSEIRHNLADETFMKKYFLAIKSALQQAKATAGGDVVGFVIEPDFLGYFQQNNYSPTNPGEGAILTQAAYDSGVLDRQTDGDFANNLNGLVSAINRTIRKYLPNAYMGWQMNLWASPDNAGQGIMHATEWDGWTAGRQKIQTNAAAVMNFAMDQGVKSANADFVSIDKYGLDGAAQNGAGANPQASNWLWNADLWNNYLLFASTLHTTSGLPVVLWQVPVGHLNSSQKASPVKYNADGKFPDLTNVNQRYEDSASTYFFGDSFVVPDPTRFNYFKQNAANDPSVTFSGNTITWGNHMQQTADAGVVAILMGAGVGDSTKGVPQPVGNPPTTPTDGYYWISAVQDYFRSPVKPAK